MRTTELQVGSFRYDTTEALFDGTVTVAGAGATRISTGRTLPEVFERLVSDPGVDASEFGLTFYLRSLEEGAPFVAVPAFPVRMFRHSSVFVTRRSGIEGPEDLVDRTIGEFGVYGQDPGVWMKGFLMDEHGFRPPIHAHRHRVSCCPWSDRTRGNVLLAREGNP